MILSMSGQAMLFLTSAAFGVAAGFFYDWLRVFRMIVSHKRFFIHAEDIFYWTFAALTLFFIMLEKNYGEIRGFLIVGAFLGMILYFFTVSVLFMRASEAVILFFKKVIRTIFKIVSMPFIVLFKISRRILRPFYTFFKKRVLKIKAGACIIWKRFMTPKKKNKDVRKNEEI